MHLIVEQLNNINNKIISVGKNTSIYPLGGGKLKSKGNSLLGIAIFGILLTTIYTAILATQLMATKHKVDYLYFKDKFSGNKY